MVVQLQGFEFPVSHSFSCALVAEALRKIFETAFSTHSIIILSLIKNVCVIQRQRSRMYYKRRHSSDLVGKCGEVGAEILALWVPLPENHIKLIVSIQLNTLLFRGVVCSTVISLCSYSNSFWTFV